MTGVSKVKCLLKTSGPGSRSCEIKRSLDVLNDYFHNLARILCRQMKRCRQWGQDPMTVGEVEQSDEEPPPTKHELARISKDEASSPYPSPPKREERERRFQSPTCSHLASPLKIKCKLGTTRKSSLSSSGVSKRELSVRKNLTTRPSPRGFRGGEGRCGDVGKRIARICTNLKRGSLLSPPLSSKGEEREKMFSFAHIVPSLVASQNQMQIGRHGRGDASIAARLSAAAAGGKGKEAGALHPGNSPRQFSGFPPVDGPRWAGQTGRACRNPLPMSRRSGGWN